MSPSSASKFSPPMIWADPVAGEERDGGGDPIGATVPQQQGGVAARKLFNEPGSSPQHKHVDGRFGTVAAVGSQPLNSRNWRLCSHWTAAPAVV